MRRILSAVVISTLALSLTGCAAGFNASTREITQVTDGAEASIISTENNIRVVNLLVVAAEGGTGVLVGTIVNAQETEDSLLGVAINGTVLARTICLRTHQLFLKATVQTQRLLSLALVHNLDHM
jgi:hypothetical protein